MPPPIRNEKTKLKTSYDPEFSQDVQRAKQAHQVQKDATEKVVRWLSQIQRNTEGSGRIQDADIRGLVAANDKLTEAEQKAAYEIDSFATKWLN
jgi:ABC-type transporter Mla subunit MlaD